MRDFAHMPASLSRTGLHPLDQCVVAQDLRRFRVVDELCLPDLRQSGGLDEFRQGGRRSAAAASRNSS